MDAHPETASQVCSVMAAAEVVCGKWTLLILRDLADAPRRFGELERSLAGISPRTLSQRLRVLEEEGIVERHVHAESPPRVEYQLTAKGRDLVPIVEAMREWGRQWATPPPRTCNDEVTGPQSAVA